MPFVWSWYVLVCYSYVAHMYLYITGTSVLVCHSYVLLCHPYVILMCSSELVCYSFANHMYLYVTRKSHVFACMSFVCYSKRLVCHLCAPPISLACTSMPPVCNSYVVLAFAKWYHMILAASHTKQFHTSWFNVTFISNYKVSTLNLLRSLMLRFYRTYQEMLNFEGSVSCYINNLVSGSQLLRINANILRNIVPSLG